MVVIGGGPAGYSAAFRAADLGIETTLIERADRLGGVCLNVGCIPSKALLHVAKVITDAKVLGDHGIHFSAPEIDLQQLAQWKQKTIDQLTGGLQQLAKLRRVEVVQGRASFVDAHTVTVTGPDGTSEIAFEQAIIAAGSRAVHLPFIPHEDPRVWDSTDALELRDIPKKLLLIGGGIIGLEMATVYSALGSKIHVVEFLDQMIPAAGRGFVKVCTDCGEGAFHDIARTKVTAGSGAGADMLTCFAPA